MKYLNKVYHFGKWNWLITVVVLGVFLYIGARAQARVSSIGPEDSRSISTRNLALEAGNSKTSAFTAIEKPTGLFIQSWNHVEHPWQSDWNDWAAGAEHRAASTNVLSGDEDIHGHVHHIDQMLAALPAGKKAVLGFSPKDSTADCYFRMWEELYNPTSIYNPLRLVNSYGGFASRTCGGEEIEYAVNYLDPDVQNVTKEVVQRFINAYKTNSKVVAFQFASGNNLEGTPWAHPGFSAGEDEQYEKTTYVHYYSDDQYANTWAEYNVKFTNWIAEALAGSGKVAYINYMQVFPNPDDWQSAVKCIGRKSNYVCSPSPSENYLHPVNSDLIGLKHSGLGEDTITGGTKGDGCTWYEPIDDITRDWWKMMLWGKHEGLPLAWEFGSREKGRHPFNTLYSEGAHLRNSLGMGLYYGADLILIYQENTENEEILEWANSYMGKSVDSSFDQPVWIMLREAIDDNNEEAVDGIASEISDPEDATFGGDGLDCHAFPEDDELYNCECGHDMQISFGIKLIETDNSSEGQVGIDDTLYGATARRATSLKTLQFDVDDDYMQGVTGVDIHIKFMKDTNDPLVRYWTTNQITQTIPYTSLNALGGSWYEATFSINNADFSNINTAYDFEIVPNGEHNWVDFVSVDKDQSSPPPPTATPTSTPTPNPEPTPDFRDQMETVPIGAFDSSRVINGATLQRDSEHLEGSYAWRCKEGSQLSNWPECEVSENLPSPQNHLVVEFSIRIDDGIQVGPVLSANNGFLWPYFDIYHQLHLFCMPPMCDSTQTIDLMPGHYLQPNTWYRIRVEALRNVSGADAVTVTAYASGSEPDQFSALWTYHNDKINLLYEFTVVRMFTRFAIDNDLDEEVYWDDFKMWYTQHPPVHVAQVFTPMGGYPQVKTFQHGEDGYWAGQDTHIVTTNWEPPTPHDTFPVTYVRVSGNEDEVMSSLIGFDQVNLPDISIPYQATLSVYFKGQSVNGGDMTVHVAGVKQDWDAPQTTWMQYQTGNNWQIAGAKGTDDRSAPEHSMVVDYTDVGKWLVFDVSQLAMEGYTSFILYGEHEGVNKSIYFPSNEYWDATKRPKLKIQYD